MLLRRGYSYIFGCNTVIWDRQATAEEIIKEAHRKPQAIVVSETTGTRMLVVEIPGDRWFDGVALFSEDALRRLIKKPALRKNGHR